jgi:hypothetical protein
MGALITACTDRIFSKELVPLAHLTFGEVSAVNDNELRFPVSPAICPYHQLGRKADEARRPRRYRRHCHRRGHTDGLGIWSGIKHSLTIHL